MSDPRSDASDDDLLAEGDLRVSAGGDWVTIQCPHCFESLEVLVDAETSGELVQDCEVCCRPWQLRVRRSHPGGLEIGVEPL